MAYILLEEWPEKDNKVGQPILETLSDWEGDVEDLARLGGQWCAMLRIDEHPDLTVRLVRDYAQRGIFDRPRREGKTAIYGWEHLVRLLAARSLLRDGWPLQKIADEFTILSLAEIRALLPGSAPPRAGMISSSVELGRNDPALDALRVIKSRIVERPSLASGQGTYSASFSRSPKITEHAALQQDLAASRQALGEGAAAVPSRAYTRLEIASGVELHIETARLRSLGRADAEAIARAVLASLLTPRLRREDKSE